jgi:uncharacterized cupredoxin-like copper-binding protein
MVMTRVTTYKTASAAAVFIPVVLLAAGCSSSSTGGGGGGLYGGGGSTNSTPASASSAAAGGAGSASSQSGAVKAGTAVTATEQEFSITLSAKTFKAGAYTFNVHNAGKYSHNLTIEGPGVDKQASPTMPGGGSSALTVTLQKGSYELWCSVDSHKDKGMDMHIEVT